MYFRTPHRARAPLPAVLAALGMFSASLALAPGAFAQTEASQPSRRARVTGRVLDAATSQPLTGANIFILGTPITATTTADGRFVITSAPTGLYTIEAKRLGYGAQRFENIRLVADSVKTLEFKLTDRPMMLDQVSVAGTVDAQSVAKSTFATSVVTAEQMPVPTTGSAAGMISGKVAGVNITRGSGRPGEGVSIQLRAPIGGFDQAGGASGNGSVPGPLFVVDGVYLNSSQQVTTQDIEGMDVASIEVIKGAAAAALYGARAAAGVISITTNRGKSLALGTTSFSYRTEYGTDSYLTKLDKNDHHQFLQDAQGNWLNAAGAIVPRQQRVTKPLGIMDAPYTSPIYNNAKQLFKDGSVLTNKADVSGNFDRSNYYVSYARSGYPGIVKYNEGYKRQSIKVNVDSRPTEHVAIGISASHSRAFDDGNPVNFTNFYAFDTDVNLQRLDPNPKFGFPYVIIPDSVTNATNPLYLSYISDNVSRRARTQINTNGSYRPFSWLSFSGDASYDRGDLQRVAYTARGTPTNTSGTLGQSTGSLVIETDITDGYTMKGGASLTKSFAGLTIRVTDQGQVQRETNPFVQATGTEFQTEGVKAMSQAKTKAVSQSFTDTRIMNNIITLGLSYNEKYIGDFLLNREGNSRFGPEARWNTFGRASAAWLMHEESWFPFQNQFQQFKLRYSWGVAGKYPDFDQQYEAFSSDGSGGITRTTLGNHNIVATKSIESEFGFDFTFMNRLQGQLTYAKGETKDNFTAVPAPAVSGYCCVTTNPATTQLQTYEATLNANIINHPQGLVFNVNLIMDQAYNQLTHFGRNCFIDGLKYSCDGARVGVMFAHAMVHSKADLRARHANSQNAFDINDEGYVVPVGVGNTWRDGVAKNLWGTNIVIDGTSYAWGNPIVNTDENGLQRNFVVGDANSKLHFGLQPDMRYKGFRLNFLLDGKLGGNAYNNVNQSFYNTCDAEVCDQFGRPDELKKPVSYYRAVSNNNSDYQEFFAQTGTYARLSEFLVGYTLDSKKHPFMKRAGISKAQFDIIGRNLKYFTKYTGLNVDPSSNLSRIDNALYPLTRTWTGAVTLTFWIGTSYFMQNSTTTVKRGPTAVRWRAIAVAAAGTLSLNGCLGLQVDNPNTLNLDNLYVSAANTEAALVGGFRRYYGMHMGVGTSNAAANCGGGVYAAWGNALFIINSTTFLENTQEPRVPIDNVNNLQCATRGPWYDAYSAIASGRESYQGIVNNKLTYGTVNATYPNGQDTPSRLIFAKFLVAMGQLSLGLRFDQAIITDVNTPSGQVGTLSPYKAVLADAVAKLRGVIADARATPDFTLPTTFVNTRAITRDELIRICQTYITRAEVYGARSVADRDAVNWAGVLARLDSGIVRDFASQADPAIGTILRSQWIELSYSQTTARISTRLLGPADTSGQYQIWASQATAVRTPITITTPDRRIHGAGGPTTVGTRFTYLTTNQTNATNAPWISSKYRSNRYLTSTSDSGNKALIVMASVDEQKYLRAEALSRLGRGTEAAALINPTRLAAGLKAVDANGPPAGRDCVPKKVDGSCGNLFDAIKYEKFIDLYPAVDPDMFWYDSRGWGTMVPGTPIHVPVSGRDLVTLGLPIYTFGGVGNPGSSP